MQVCNIKYANEQAGQHFFSPSTMRFFKCRVGEKVYKGEKLYYFVTSERFDWDGPRMFTVRKFDPETGYVDTVGEFNQLTRYLAHKIASELK